MPDPIMRRHANWPDKKDLWGNGLYTIYYKLNMGEEFKEIEKLMQM